MDIFDAAEAGDVQRLRQLIENDPSLVHARTRVNDDERGAGNTPLHRAAWQDRAEAVKLLLDCGADIEAKDADHGATPLAYCAWRANVGSAKVLLDRGADPDATNKYGETAMKIAQIGAAGGLKHHHFARSADKYRADCRVTGGPNAKTQLIGPRLPMFIGRVRFRSADMDLFLIVACLIGAWAFFSIIGNERQRRLQLLELEHQRARQAAAAQAQAQAPQIPTIG